jgi:hypothetical protein
VNEAAAPFGPFGALAEALLDQVRQIVREEVSSAQPAPSGWLSVKSAATYLDMEIEALRSAVRRGKVPVHQGLSGRMMFDRAELDEAVRQGL